MTDGEDFKSVGIRPQDDAVVAYSSATAALPLAMHWRHVPSSGFAESRDCCKNSQGGWAIDRPELSLRLSREREAQRLAGQHLGDHLVKGTANDGLSGVGLS